MAAMSTTLTQFATFGDSRTWTTSGHTAAKPKLVIQKRRVPTGQQTVQETTISVIHATANAAGETLPQKVALSLSVRAPIDGTASDIANALVILRDICASDEFTGTTTTQNFIK